jgi:exopolysaccharide biosynthesis operon protein EpsL
MLQFHIKKIPAWYLLLFSCVATAEGIIDINPYISPNIVYDDNVFRFTSPTQAQQAFGSDVTSDVIKRLNVGVDVNLRISRQTVNLTADLADSRYNRFSLLDNTAKSYGATWNWRLGNDFYGALRASKNESIVGFTEIRNPVKNTRQTERQSASIYWNFHPDWAVFAIREQAQTSNELASFEALDRDETISEAGVRFQNPLGTQLGLSYRILESNYPNRTGFAAIFFGDESKQSALVFNAAWLPTPKTRLSTRLSQLKIDYEDNPQREFSGFSQRWDIGHSLTSKVTLNASAYREVSPIDDVLSTYVESTGASFNPSWNMTSKVSLRGGISYEEREYLGSGGLFAGADDRNDNSKTANLALIYSPTIKSLLQLQYQGEKRESSFNNQGYRFNTLSFIARYSF